MMKKHKSLKLDGTKDILNEKECIHKIQVLKINLKFSDQALEAVNELYFRKVERNEQKMTAKERILQKVKLGKRVHSERDPDREQGSWCDEQDEDLLRIIEKTNNV
jgi:hypothetical protein